MSNESEEQRGAAAAKIAFGAWFRDVCQTRWKEAGRIQTTFATLSLWMTTVVSVEYDFQFQFASIKEKGEREWASDRKYLRTGLILVLTLSFHSAMIATNTNFQAISFNLVRNVSPSHFNSGNIRIVSWHKKATKGREEVPQRKMLY